MTVSELSHRGEQTRRLLFVCVENSCRSQVAQAFVRKHGIEEKVKALLATL